MPLHVVDEKRVCACMMCMCVCMCVHVYALGIGGVASMNTGPWRKVHEEPWIDCQPRDSSKKEGKCLSCPHS